MKDIELYNNLESKTPVSANFLQSEVGKLSDKSLWVATL